MKLGVFLPNGQNGYIISKNSPQYIPTWKHCLAITKEAERVGLDFILSMIKYHGFGGETGYWDSCLDSISLASGLAAATDRIELYATVPVLGVHPAVAARMIATFNDISGGRAGVNIVTGWNRPEYSQMGLWPSDDYHDRRYELTGEYIRIMRELWATGRSSFKGDYFRLDDCECFPTPGRDIPIVCAGQSPKGVQFTARHAEYNFVFGGPEKLKRIAEPVLTESAKIGRKVGTLALVTIIGADTDAEAKDRCDDIVAGADQEALLNVVKSASMDTNPEGTSRHFRDGMTADVTEGNLTFMGFPVIHGSWESIALQIQDLEAKTGISGMLLTFPEFVEGVRSFGERSLPLLRGGAAARKVA
ncbi:LLM class flavin-dependent oxidoreductase [Hansschlegelia quercus]|uniref:LLM class flavin-dependent oxidoreductase n=1 Tax=Hansschlegelia quercus TaxID=2528245 RepID=A0A4Q9GJX2_9HYPH|nr:LLM class flavin-dependent oxidoreductase [Hansschlegelia quercus]TBN53601.1 LLM class flavin-dependent oxidoreductase [Hansschlegelia quercus]